MRVSTAASLVALAVGSVATSTAAVGNGAASTDAGRSRAGAIAFVSARDGVASSIYVVDDDGTGLRRLVAGRVDLREGTKSDAEQPAWSPDGTMLAFSREGLHVIDVEGARARRLARIEEGDGPPEWSPDSRWLAFAYRGRIYAVRADGSATRTIASGWHPTWSPDGSKIAFARAGHVYVANKDGTRTTRITPDGFPAAEDAEDVEEVEAVTWSPDSRKIAVVRGDYEPQLYVADAAGSGVIALGRLCDTLDPSVVWSPAGDSIAMFSSDDRLVVARADGSGARPLSGGTNRQCGPVAWAPDGRSLALPLDKGTYVVSFADGGAVRVSRRAADALAWSPNGKLIALSAAAGDARDVWLANPDGSGERRLTQGFRYGYANGFPIWHPRGRRARQLGGVAVSPAIPTDSLPTRRTLRTTSMVDRLSADGAAAAAAYRLTPNCIEHWEPAKRSTVRFHEQACIHQETGGEAMTITGLALADERLAWSTVTETNYSTHELLVATSARPRAVSVFSITDDGQIEHVAGDGSLLVFVSTAYVSRHRTNATLWLVFGDGRRRGIRRYERPPTALSVDGGRIAVLRADGAVEVVRSSGAVAMVLRPGLARPSDIALDRPVLAVAARDQIVAYDVRNGRLAGRWTLRRGRPRLVDLARGIALLRDGRTIRLLRLRDGREVVVRPRKGPVNAQLERAGLFYSHVVARSSSKGRIVFVPFDELVRRFGHDKRASTP